MRRLTADGRTVFEARTPAGSVISLWIARTLRERLVGLSRLRGLKEGHALLIPRCRSVHTIGMRFPLDIAFGELDAVPGDLRLLAIHRGVPPWRTISYTCSPPSRAGARVAALELAGGQAARLGLSEGAVVRIDAGET